MRSLLAAAVVLVVCTAGFSQDGAPPPGETLKARVEVDEKTPGAPVLVIHYPWKVHGKASIEMRLLADKESDAIRVRPLNFVELFVKGPITNAVYEARDKAWDLPYSSRHTERGREFEIRGQQNELGRPSVAVVLPGVQTAAEQRVRQQEDTSPRAVFYLLESWAMNDTTLRLELPEPYFAKPGRIRLWFLREGDLLWSETVAWPGVTAGK